MVFKNINGKGLLVFLFFFLKGNIYGEMKITNEKKKTNYKSFLYGIEKKKKTISFAS
jgi:hypothetical protein